MEESTDSADRLEIFLASVKSKSDEWSRLAAFLIRSLA